MAARFDHDDLEELLTLLEKGEGNPKSLLDHPIFFRDLFLEGENAALFIKKNPNGKNTDEYDHHLVTMDIIVDDCLRIHSITPHIFKEILNQSGFKPAQISNFTKALREADQSIGLSIEVLLDSKQKEINIFQNPRTQKLLSVKGFALNEDELFSSFLEYVIEAALPSVKMENIAKLSIYQLTKFNQSLEQSDELKQLFNTFKKNGKLSPKEQGKAGKLIKNDIETMLNEATLGIQNEKKNTSFAVIKPFPKNTNVWTKTVSGSRPDAAGFDQHSNCHLACVTSRPDFTNQDHQAFDWANRLRNGIESGLLKINNFIVYAICNPIFNEDDSGTTFKNFQEVVADLSSKNDLTEEEVYAIKRIPIDCELLSTLSNKSLDNYDTLRTRLRYGIAGSSELIIPGEKKSQHEESLNYLATSLVALEKIINNDEELRLIKTVYGVLLEQVHMGIEYGLNSVLRGPHAHLQHADAQSCSLRIKNLLAAIGHSTSRNIGVMGFLTREEDVFSTPDTLNSSFASQQKVVEYYKTHPPLYDESKWKELKSQDTSWDLDPDSCHAASLSSKLAMILSLSYRDGDVPQKLLVKAFDAQIKVTQNKYRESKNYHSLSIDKLARGFVSTYTSPYPYDLKEIYQKLSQDKYSHLSEKVEALLAEIPDGQKFAQRFTQGMMDHQKLRPISM